MQGNGPQEAGSSHAWLLVSTKRGDYITIIIISAPGQDPQALQERPGPSLSHSPAKGARLLGHFPLPLEEG